MADAGLTGGAALDLDTALYGDDAIERDAARGRLARTSSREVLSALVRALEAPERVTRRRAGRLLTACKPALVRPLVAALAQDTAATERHRASATRLLSLLAPAGEPLLAPLLADASARVRRAAATPAAPVDALLGALDDVDAGVVREALLALGEREVRPPVERFRAIFERHGQTVPEAARAFAAANSGTTRGLEAAAELEADAIDHLAATTDAVADADAHAAVWARLLAQPETRLAALEARLRAGILDERWADDADARIRAAFARNLPAAHGLLPRLADDRSPGVAWLAKQNLAGVFAAETLAARTSPHARLNAPSARPPFGLSADDSVASPPRAPAALALCHTRFDVNLGVAVRSAEAAGLREVFLIGRGELLRSPARGTDQVIPVTHLPDPAALIRRCRDLGHQLVVVQQTPASVPYTQASYPPRPLFVLGAEDEGVPASLRRAADLLVEIPLYGVIDSLNVAAAATCVLFHWRAHLVIG